MLISCCEIFAPKPVSRSHTPAETDALLFFKRILFYFFMIFFFIMAAPLVFFVDGEQRKKAAPKYLPPLMIRKIKVVRSSSL